MDTPCKVGTTASCPHVIDIKNGKTTGGLVGGNKFGSPEEIQSLVTIVRERATYYWYSPQTATGVVLLQLGLMKFLQTLQV